jgi:hypothetical protein
MTEQRFALSKDARAAGWFSRRHETREANDAARESYRSRAERRPLQRWTGSGWEKVQ